MIASPIRWAGGKRWLVERLVPEIVEANPRLYVEPFLGGGAVMLAVPTQIPKLAADANPTLMDMWFCLQKYPKALIDEVNKVANEYGNEQDGYLFARRRLNNMIGIDRPYSIQRAALFLYINARCFNGLWRTNSSGLFNVPFGKLKNPSTIDLDEAKALSTALANVKLHVWDYKETLYRAAISSTAKYRGLAIYADSPYHDTFSQYTKGDFTDDDQRELAKHLHYAWNQGARVWATNADTALIREIYSWAKLEEISEQHNVGATGDRRGKRSCLLIRG